jgi:hypothetical protein
MTLRDRLVHVGLIAIVGPLLSISLSRFEAGLDARVAGAYLHRFPEENTLYLFCLAIALLAWSWASGLLLGIHSKGVLWLAVAFYPVVLNFWAMRALFYSYLPPDIPWMALVSFRLLPLRVSEVLFVVPAFLGVWRSLKQPPPGRRLTVVALTITAFFSAFLGWLSGPRGVPWQTHPLAIILLIWPAALLLAAGLFTRTGRRSLVGK